MRTLHPFLFAFDAHELFIQKDRYIADDWGIDFFFLLPVGSDRSSRQGERKGGWKCVEVEKRKEGEGKSLHKGNTAGDWIWANRFLSSAIENMHKTTHSIGHSPHPLLLNRKCRFIRKNCAFFSPKCPRKIKKQVKNGPGRSGQTWCSFNTRLVMRQSNGLPLKWNT